jgi:hypothetical protein
MGMYSGFESAALGIIKVDGVGQPKRFLWRKSTPLISI